MIRFIPPDDTKNYVTVLADEGDPLERLETPGITARFREHGALLLRGFGYDLQSLSRFTSCFCSRFVRNESGRRSRISQDGTTQSVNLGREPFPLHPELSRVPWRPDIAWFACARPPSAGGETLVCDGAAIVDLLSEPTRQSVQDRGILYREETPIAAFTDWLGIPRPDDDALAALSRESPFRFLRSEGRIFRQFTRPFLHQSLFGRKRVFGNFLLFARYMLGTREFPLFEDGSVIPDELVEELKTVSDSITVAHRWRGGDILMLDNSRFMHGRNAVTEPEERRIWTQFGYASFLDDEDPRLAEPWRYTDDALSIFFGPAADELRMRRRSPGAL
jgi:alpha-ketoglutarate-dependent taurine dioxygenase